READQWIAQAQVRPEVDRRDAGGPVVDVGAADAEIGRGRGAARIGQRFVVEVAHAGARFHDQRVAPRARVVDAGTVGGVGAGAGESIAGRAALLGAAEAGEVGWIGDVRPQETHPRANLIDLTELRIHFGVE